MEEIVKAISKTILIQQSANIGSKFFNEKQVTKSDWQSLFLALAVFAVINLPTPQYNSPTLKG